MTDDADLALLGVNIDHVATLRQARGTRYPEPVHAALIAQEAGADAITVHLREDRRHIQDRDVELIAQVLHCRLNLEIAVTGQMLAIAERLRPPDCCLVPEKREEITTEGGLDVVGTAAAVREACERLAGADVRVSLFIDPDLDQVRAAADAGAPVVELHTGSYAEARDESTRATELARIERATTVAIDAGLQVNAGHGLHYHNVQPVAAISGLTEFNIGHAIVARAVFSGLASAVAEMKRLLRESRGSRTA